MTGTVGESAAGRADIGDRYAQSVTAWFAALKEITAPAELEAAALPLREMPGTLLPICRVHESDRAAVELLARWRARNMAAYPTQFEVTLEGTARWLRELVLDVP